MTNALTVAVPFPSTTGSLDTYVQAVNRYPLLTQEQETALARRLRDEGDVDAARQLVLRTCACGVDCARLSGLRITPRRSDPGRQRRPDEGGKALRSDRGVRLVSFAVHWIRAEIHDSS